MDIVFCCDQNFIEHCGIAIVSLLENNSRQDIVIHVIGLDLRDSDKEILYGIVTEKYKKRIEFYTIKMSDLDKYNLPFNSGVSEYRSIATYIRLFLSDILPSNIDKVIYLDGDLVVLGDLCQFYKTDLTGYSVAGVLEYDSFGSEIYHRLGYPKSQYVNAGVLLINLKYWRENDILSKFLNYISNNRDRIVAYDQDVINAVLHESVLVSSYRYNMHNSFYQKKYILKEYGPDVDESRLSPVIVHFTSVYKPWSKDTLHPMKHEYVKYRQMSPWADKPLEWRKKDFSHIFRYYKRLFILKLGKSRYVRI